jgi:hypothetical protein
MSDADLVLKLLPRDRTAADYKPPLLIAPSGKILYAVAWEKWFRGVQVSSTIEYLHAYSMRDAKRIFKRSKPRLPGVRYRIVAAAPAVGFHVNDNHGESLEA